MTTELKFAAEAEDAGEAGNYDGEAEPIGREELLQQLRDAGILSAQGYRRRSKSTARHIDELLGQSSDAQAPVVVSGVFPTLQHRLDEIKDNHRNIDRLVRYRESPVLAASHQVSSTFLRLIGVRGEIATLEELVDLQLHTFETTQQELATGLQYSKAVMEHVQHYRDDIVVPGLAEAAQAQQGMEKRLEQYATFYLQVEAELRRTKIIDPHYVDLENSHAKLRRFLMQGRNEVTRQQRRAVFNSKEKDILTDLEQLAITGTNVMLLGSDYVSDAVRHIRNTRPVYRAVKENCVSMAALYVMHRAVTDCVLTGADEVGRALSDATEMGSRLEGEEYLPDKLGPVVAGYRHRFLGLEARNRARFERKAEELMEGYARPALPNGKA